MAKGNSRVPNPFGDTAIYNKRLERHQARLNGTWKRVRNTPAATQADHRRETKDEDWLKHSRVVALERECVLLNEQTGCINDPWVIDWIRDYELGGAYKFENLRIVRFSQQGNPQERTHEQIVLLTKMVAAQRKLV